MLRRRARPPATPPPRPAAIRVLAGAPHRVEPVSADLLPSRARGRATAPAPVAAPVATAPTVVLPTDPTRMLRRRTVDERATRIRAMAHAAARRVPGRR